MLRDLIVTNPMIRHSVRVIFDRTHLLWRMHVLHMIIHCSGKRKPFYTARVGAWHSVIQMCGTVMLLSIFGRSERFLTVIN